MAPIHKQRLRLSERGREREEREKRGRHALRHLSNQLYVGMAKRMVLMPATLLLPYILHKINSSLIVQTNTVNYTIQVWYIFIYD